LQCLSLPAPSRTRLTWEASRREASKRRSRGTQLVLVDFDPFYCADFRADGQREDGKRDEDGLREVTKISTYSFV
jgi:hypothetical protein